MAAVTLLALTACDDARPSPARPDPTPTSWVESLPDGEPPGVPYAVGTRLHLPDGTRVPIDGAELEILDVTPRGTMLLVERYDPSFDTDYVWVARDGTKTVLADTLSHGVQDAAVSPDGRLFARGGEVVDLADGSVVAEIPPAAVIVTGWVEGGLVYDDRRSNTYLWRPGRAPFELGDRTFFSNRTDVGLVVERGCRAVVHVYPGTDHTEEWGTRCGGPHALTVSPGGEWIVDRRLRLVDAAQEKARALLGERVGVPVSADAYWESRHVVLIALPSGVLRCDALERSCEWALSRQAELPLR